MKRYLFCLSILLTYFSYSQEVVLTDGATESDFISGINDSLNEVLPSLGIYEIDVVVIKLQYTDKRILI